MLKTYFFKSFKQGIMKPLFKLLLGFLARSA